MSCQRWILGIALLGCTGTARRVDVVRAGTHANHAIVAGDCKEASRQVDATISGGHVFSGLVRGTCHCYLKAEDHAAGVQWLSSLPSELVSGDAVLLECSAALHWYLGQVSTAASTALAAITMDEERCVAWWILLKATSDDRVEERASLSQRAADCLQRAENRRNGG